MTARKQRGGNAHCTLAFDVCVMYKTSAPCPARGKGAVWQPPLLSGTSQGGVSPPAPLLHLQNKRLTRFMASAARMGVSKHEALYFARKQWRAGRSLCGIWSRGVSIKQMGERESGWWLLDGRKHTLPTGNNKKRPNFRATACFPGNGEGRKFWGSN